MPAFILNSDIKIGIPGVNEFKFSGVHEIIVRRSIHSYIDTAVIKLPSISKIKYKNKETTDTITTGEIWKDGDPVSISVGYDEGMREEFRGFIKRKNLTIPLEIECEGYSWLLRKNNINGSWKTITVKKMLELAVSNLPKVGNNTPAIKVVCDNNTELTNFYAFNYTGADIINSILQNTDNNLAIFFIEPDVLWCGLLYTPYQEGKKVLGLAQVKYRLGYNLVKENTLKERTPLDNPINVHYVKKKATGERISAATGIEKEIRKYKKFLNRIADSKQLKALATEKKLRENYTGYEGRIQGFLQPFALPGYTAYLVDDRYPKKNGIYFIESTEVIFGSKGARRIIEIGPKVGSVNTTQ